MLLGGMGRCDAEHWNLVVLGVDASPIDRGNLEGIYVFVVEETDSLV